MKIGKNLLNARKKSGLTQEEVAEKLGVSRQTISNWELDETLPDIFQSKKLSKLYNLSLDELIEFDSDLKEIENTIIDYNEEKMKKINWTKAWSKKYLVLAMYQKEVDSSNYSSRLRIMLEELKKNYNYSEVDAVLVLKDILAHEMKK